MTPGRTNQSLLRDDRGAVAATYALGLTALVAIAGLGFDYARLVTMDSELQNGADQAALAGATQLDGKSGTCARASAAARTLVSNITILANDGAGTAITMANETACDAVGSIRFWEDRDKAKHDQFNVIPHFASLRLWSGPPPIATRSAAKSF